MAWPTPAVANMSSAAASVRRSTTRCAGPPRVASSTPWRRATAAPTRVQLLARARRSRHEQRHRDDSGHELARRRGVVEQHGSCVDTWAPGVSILSTRKGGGTTTMSGTSMASPHVAGGGALYLSSHTGTPSVVESSLKAAATATSQRSKDGRLISRLYVGGF